MGENIRKIKMSKQLKILSRSGTKRIISQINPYQYTIEGESLYHRCSSSNDAGQELILDMVDFESGPCLFLNEKMFMGEALNDDRSISKLEIIECIDNNLKVRVTVR